MARNAADVTHGLPPRKRRGPLTVTWHDSAPTSGRDSEMNTCQHSERWARNMRTLKVASCLTRRILIRSSTPGGTATHVYHCRPLWCNVQRRLVWHSASTPPTLDFGRNGWE